MSRISSKHQATLPVDALEAAGLNFGHEAAHPRDQVVEDQLSKT